jgi:hypothetical protein
MYELLQDISRRPEPFSRYTAMELWTRPYLARQMLSFHLNQDTELASRPFETIDQIVNWIAMSSSNLPRRGRSSTGFSTLRQSVCRKNWNLPVFLSSRCVAT